MIQGRSGGYYYYYSEKELSRAKKLTERFIYSSMERQFRIESIPVKTSEIEWIALNRALQK
jgi:hypothetical protein